MAETDIGGAISSDLTNVIVDYSVDSQVTDASSGAAEFSWQMVDWETNLGYYKEIPELQSAIDTETLWTMGAGFEADPTTTMLLGAITGNGKDSFNTILSNSIRTATIGGDSFTEVIRDKDGVLVNLKVLDPASIVIVQDSKGRIKRYEQVSRTKEVKKKFKPERIFHLSRKRIADEIHGISVIDSVKWIILARNEAMVDTKTMFHRHVIPRFKYELDTDDTAEIAAFKAKEDAATGKGENIYIPKGAVEVEVLSVPPNSTLNPLSWIDKLTDYFYQACGVPQIIMGNAKSFTDASGKIVYLAYEQTVKAKQLYVEEQVLGQLNLEINLRFPASMQADLITSVEKDGEGLEAAEPADTVAELEGPT